VAILQIGLRRVCVQSVGKCATRWWRCRLSERARFGSVRDISWTPTSAEVLAAGGKTGNSPRCRSGWGFRASTGSACHSEVRRTLGLEPPPLHPQPRPTCRRSEASRIRWKLPGSRKRCKTSTYKARLGDILRLENNNGRVARLRDLRRFVATPDRMQQHHGEVRRRVRPQKPAPPVHSRRGIIGCQQTTCTLLDGGLLRYFSAETRSRRSTAICRNLNGALHGYCVPGLCYWVGRPSNDVNRDNGFEPRARSGELEPEGGFEYRRTCQSWLHGT
jgi:hypothetical protein